MDLRQLLYFVTIAEKHTYTKAAKALHISQPSLSNAILKLENELGFSIFERRAREMRLTDGGKVLYEQAKELLRNYDNLKREMGEVRQIGAGSISIGVIESAMHWLPKVIKMFKQNFPSVQIQLRDVLGKEKTESVLKNYDVHFVITNQILTDATVQSTPIYHESLVLLLPEHHHLVEKVNVQLEDLINEPFILSKKGFQTREDILQAFDKRGIVPNVMYEYERFETACSLVEEGLGITILPENYLKYSHPHQIVVRQIDQFDFRRTVYLASMKQRHLSPSIYAFEEKISEFFNV